jgi:hypothetical protein
VTDNDEPLPPSRLDGVDVVFGSGPDRSIPVASAPSAALRFLICIVIGVPCHHAVVDATGSFPQLNAACLDHNRPFRNLRRHERAEILRRLLIGRNQIGA